MEPDLIQAISRRAVELAQVDGSLGAVTARHWLQAKREFVDHEEAPLQERDSAQ